MADRGFGHLTQNAYQLRPRRSRIASFARWCVTCAACLALGAAAATGAGHAPAPALPCAPATTLQQDDATQLELTRTRLALQQEVAARTAVQETADASAAEVRRLNEELRFLRGQTQPPRR